MDGLRRACAVVVADVLSDDTADVADAEEDEVIQSFLAKRPHEAFDEWGSVRCTVGDRLPLDEQMLSEESGFSHMREDNSK